MIHKNTDYDNVGLYLGGMLLFTMNTKKIRNKVRKATVKLAQDEQYKISLECKRNPKKFWHYINRKTTSKISIGDLHWTDPNGKAISAERDSDKAAA